jgi:hypothetical protein
MSPTRHPTVDKNVPPNCKPVAGLEQRMAGMHWSDRVWYWLVSLGGLALAAAGVAVIAYLGRPRWGGILIGVGFVIFILGSPSQAARNGYRSS